MISPQAAMELPYVSYVSPVDVSSAGRTAQDYINGVLKYWDHDACADLSQEQCDQDGSYSNEMDFEMAVPITTTTIRLTSPPSRPVVPQLQDYQKQLLALEKQNNKRILIARELQTPATANQTMCEQQQQQTTAQTVKAEEDDVAAVEGYATHLLAMQAQVDANLHQVREQEEEREAEERKRELERIWYMRRKDSGIYCESVYTTKGCDEDIPLPEDMERYSKSRRGSRIDNWVEAQAQRRYCGLTDDVMLPKKPSRLLDAKLPHSAVNNIFSDFKYQLSGFERFNDQIDRRRRMEQGEHVY